MPKHSTPATLNFETLINIHNYFNRLDGTKSETAKEIINEIETRIISQIKSNPTGTQSHGKSEIR